jgi:predicted ATP-grasp superfamily ATP-dependent carboligase
VRWTWLGYERVEGVALGRALASQRNNNNALSEKNEKREYALRSTDVWRLTHPQIGLEGA